MSLDGSGHDLDTLLRVRNIKASAPRHNRRHANPQQLHQETHSKDDSVPWWNPDLVPVSQPLPEPSNIPKSACNKDDIYKTNAQKGKDDDSVKKRDQEQDQNQDEEGQQKGRKEDAKEKKKDEN